MKRGFYILILSWGVFSGTAQAARVCSNFLTYPQVAFQLPLEASFAELMEHVLVGTLSDTAGPIQVKSGLHSWAGFKSVLQSHGISPEQALWESFEGQAVDAENRQAPLSVQIEELPHGVIRVQLGESFWTHAQAMANARVTVEPGKAFMGNSSI